MNSPPAAARHYIIITCRKQAETANFVSQKISKQSHILCWPGLIFSIWWLQFSDLITQVLMKVINWSTEFSLTMKSCCEMTGFQTYNAYAHTGPDRQRGVPQSQHYQKHTLFTLTSTACEFQWTTDRNSHSHIRLLKLQTWTTTQVSNRHWKG